MVIFFTFCTTVKMTLSAFTELSLLCSVNELLQFEVFNSEEHHATTVMTSVPDIVRCVNFKYRPYINIMHSETAN